MYRQTRTGLVCGVLVACVFPAAAALAGVPSKAAGEAAEFVLRKFGKEAAEYGVSSMAERLEKLAARYGTEALQAARRVGPAGIRAVEQAGEQGDIVVQLLARHGDEALWLTVRSDRLALFARFGDDAAEAMLRHREIAGAFVEQFGVRGARAMKSLGGQNARRLAMLTADGGLHRLGRVEEVLDLIARYGDRAMDFVWRNKGALAVSATLAAFLANPEPFLNGTRDLAKIGAETMGTPLATASGEVAKEAARNVNWTAILLAGLTAAAVLVVRYRVRGRFRRGGKRRMS